MRRWIKCVALGLFTSLAGLVISISPLGNMMETGLGLTWLFHLRGPIVAPDDVRVVGIDGRTGEQLQIPESPQNWLRSTHAQLIDELDRRGASVIVFDIFFGAIKNPQDDQLFTEAISRSNRVQLVEKLTGKKQPVYDQQGLITGTVWLEELVSPAEPFADASRALAPFPLPKLDAAVYEFWNFKDSVGDAPTMPATALQLHALSFYDQFVKILTDQGAVLPEGIASSSKEISNASELRETMRELRRFIDKNPRLVELLQKNGSRVAPPAGNDLLHSLFDLYGGDSHRYINFYGPPGTITTVPYQAVLNGGDPNLPAHAMDFTDKVVFVGYSDLYDPGQPDRFYTVYTADDGVDLSGVEIAATAFANLLTDQSVVPPSFVDVLLVMVSLGMAFAVIFYALPAIVGVPLGFAIAVGYTVASSWLFNSHQLWMPLTVPLLVQMPLALIIGLLSQYLFERQRGIRISEAISYYLPENIARDLSDNKLDASTINNVVYSTCLATDMAGFSTIAEEMPPRELAEFLNEYFETLSQPLKNNGVDVTEFRADAIMCAWTSPVSNSEVRLRPIRAALEAVDAIDQFKRKYSNMKARLRVGLECGNVYVGHAGGGGHFVYSIVGDCANTASRIEGLNKHLGTQLLATELVLEGVQDQFLLRKLGKFQFVGKTEGLPIVEVLANTNSASEEQRSLSARFAEALENFHQCHWSVATKLFQKLLEDFPDDGPSGYFLALSESYLNGATPPEDPTTVVMTSK